MSTPSAPSVYFDHNATTPLDSRVCESMLPWLGELHGNPSSGHGCGRRARQAVEEARAEVAALVGGAAAEVLFVSSGTEANNAVLYAAAGIFDPERRVGGHLVVSALEHPSIRAGAERARTLGMEVTELLPGADGRVDPDEVEEALRPDTRLVCLMLASNVLGTLQPVSEAAARARRRGVAVLCDAVQAVGKIPVDARALGVDFLTLGGHKFHGPPGVGALWVRPGAPYEPLLVGAPQEAGRRAGTENVPAIVGLGRAAALARAELAERRRHLARLRDLFEDGLERIPDAVVHCRGSERLPNTSHVAFPGLEGHELMRRLDRRGFAVSTGSACHSSHPQPDPVLAAVGVPASEAFASLRVSFGMPNRAEEVEAFVEALAEEVAALRAMARSIPA